MSEVTRLIVVRHGNTFNSGDVICRVEEDQIVRRLLDETHQFLDGEAAIHNDC